jgi:N-acetylglucosaminyldiphosphoundecaprenol N-acetyl-beta-D-mannosaminyltransferase
MIGRSPKHLYDRCVRARIGYDITSPEQAGTWSTKIRVGDLWFDAVTQDQVVDVVREAWSTGQGGSIIPVNIDVARAATRDAALAELVDRGSLVIADGMPLVWAAWLRGGKLPERVAGSSLIFPLSAAAAADGKSVYLLGGAEGVPEKAAAALVAQCGDLRVAGVQSPPLSFDDTEDGARQAISAVKAASADLVFVALGFPRQERLIEQLRQELPNAWFLACGGGISMAAGVARRASPVIQRLGFEWLHRLALEPRRLARRYLRDDLPFALALLARSGVERFRRS